MGVADSGFTNGIPKNYDDMKEDYMPGFDSDQLEELTDSGRDCLVGLLRNANHHNFEDQTSEQLLVFYNQLKTLIRNIEPIGIPKNAESFSMNHFKLENLDTCISSFTEIIWTTQVVCDEGVSPHRFISISYVPIESQGTQSADILEYTMVGSNDSKLVHNIDEIAHFDNEIINLANQLFLAN